MCVYFEIVLINFDLHHPVAETTPFAPIFEQSINEKKEHKTEGGICKRKRRRRKALTEIRSLI